MHWVVVWCGLLVWAYAGLGICLIRGRGTWLFGILSKEAMFCTYGLFFSRRVLQKCLHHYFGNICRRRWHFSRALSVLCVHYNTQ